MQTPFCATSSLASTLESGRQERIVENFPGTREVVLAKLPWPDQSNAAQSSTLSPRHLFMIASFSAKLELLFDSDLSRQSRHK